MASVFATLSTALLHADPPLADRIGRDEIGIVRGILVDESLGSEQRFDGLVSVLSRIAVLRSSGSWSLATRWIALLEEVAPLHADSSMFLIYAAGERLEIDLHRGAPDQASQSLVNLRERIAKLGQESERADLLKGVALLYELDYRVATEDFVGAVAQIDSAGPEIRQAFEADLENRRAYAEAGRACFGADEAIRATTILERRITASTPEQRGQLPYLLASIQIQRGDVQAARQALEYAGDLDVEQPSLALRRATLLVQIALGERAGLGELRRLDQDLAATIDVAVRRQLAEADPDDAVAYLHYDFAARALACRIAVADALGEPTRAVEAVLRAQSFSRLVRRIGSPIETVEELLRAIPSGRLVLCYVPSPDGSWLIAIDSHEVKLHRLDTTYLLKRTRDQLARAAVQVLSAGEIESWSRVAWEASRGLLPEAAHAAIRAADSLSICALGPLASTCFELLPFDDESLGTKFAIDRLPALPLLRALSERTSRPVELNASSSIECALLLDPEFSLAVAERYPAVVQLPFSRDSLAELAAPYPPQCVSLEIGPDANRVAFDRARRATMLTFLGHGIERFERLRPATLVLAPSQGSDGLLGCEDVEAADCARVVLLGACRAGRGPLRGGNESAMDLGGAFLASGAGAVLLAAFPLEAEGARTTLLHVHRRLADGASLAEAVRSARKNSAERGEAFGAWIVVGSGHQPIFVGGPRPPTRAGWWWIGLILAAVTTVTLVVVRRRAG